ncbi:hypothetical protein ACLOJK_022152 [Asimina triloba]
MSSQWWTTLCPAGHTHQPPSQIVQACLPPSLASITRLISTVAQQQPSPLASITRPIQRAPSCEPISLDVPSHGHFKKGSPKIQPATRQTHHPRWAVSHPWPAAHSITHRSRIQRLNPSPSISRPVGSKSSSGSFLLQAKPIPHPLSQQQADVSNFPQIAINNNIFQKPELSIPSPGPTSAKPSVSVPKLNANTWAAYPTQSKRTTVNEYKLYTAAIEPSIEILKIHKQPNPQALQNSMLKYK